ncbi:MAG: hypothetical protein ACXVDD_23950, partial [Polyangia bacterium]
GTVTGLQGGMVVPSIGSASIEWAPPAAGDQKKNALIAARSVEACFADLITLAETAGELTPAQTPSKADRRLLEAAHDELHRLCSTPIQCPTPLMPLLMACDSSDKHESAHPECANSYVKMMVAGLHHKQ